MSIKDHYAQAQRHVLEGRQLLCEHNLITTQGEWIWRLDIPLQHERERLIGKPAPTHKR